MSKTVFITRNSKEIRDKLEKAGFNICVCAEFDDAVWLDYYPNGHFPYDIHGEGYAGDDNCDLHLTPLERIKDRLKIPGWYAEEKEFFDNVDDFIEKYG